MIITTRQLGKKTSPIEDWHFQPPPEIIDPGDGGITLRDLLIRIVHDEVAQFHKRQREKTLVHILSKAEIHRAAPSGKVTMGAQEFQQKVEPDEAVATALQAFEDGLYLVFIDEDEQRNLDAQVYVTADSRLTFMQLTFLAGA